MSVDPGIVNLAIRIEERNQEEDTMETIYYAKLIIDKNNIFESVMEKLDDLQDIIQNCHVVVVEKQLNSKNLQAVKVETFILSTLLMMTRNLEHTPRIGTMSGKIKYTHHDIKGKGKYNKEMAPVVASKILRGYGDEFSLKILNNSKKKDDFADTVLMCSLVSDIVDVL